MTKLLNFGILIVIFGLSVTTLGQNSISKKAEKQQKKIQAFETLLDIVENKPLEFVAEWAFPVGYGSVNLVGNSNYLRLMNDSVDMYMPFFGRAYRATPGEEGGFVFKGIVFDKKVELDKNKREIRIDFVLKAESDRYRCSLEILGKESVTLQVTSNDRAAISYNGDIEEWKRESE